MYLLQTMYDKEMICHIDMGFATGTESLDGIEIDLKNYEMQFVNKKIVSHPSTL